MSSGYLVVLAPLMTQCSKVHALRDARTLHSLLLDAGRGLSAPPPPSIGLLSS